MPGYKNPSVVILPHGKLKGNERGGACYKLLNFCSIPSLDETPIGNFTTWEEKQMENGEHFRKTISEKTRVL